MVVRTDVGGVSPAQKIITGRIVLWGISPGWWTRVACIHTIYMYICLGGLSLLPTSNMHLHVFLNRLEEIDLVESMRAETWKTQDSAQLGFNVLFTCVYTLQGCWVYICGDANRETSLPWNEGILLYMYSSTTYLITHVHVIHEFVPIYSYTG